MVRLFFAALLVLADTLSLFPDAPAWHGIVVAILRVAEFAVSPGVRTFYDVL